MKTLYKLQGTFNFKTLLSRHLKKLNFISDSTYSAAFG